MKIYPFPISGLLCHLLFYLSLSVNASEQQVDIQTINTIPYIKVINRTGKLGFKRTLNLSFKTAGYLAKINIDEGDSFVKGQVLAELDTFELITEKNSTYARLLQAKNDVSRIKSLRERNLGSRQELDNAQTLVETTRAAHKLAQYNLDKSQITAPFDGVVITRFSDLAELQNPSQVVLHVAAMNDNLVLRVALTSEEVSMLQLNQQAQVEFSHGLMTGTVSKVALMSDVISQLYTIEVLLAGIKSNELVVGQFANAIINIDSNRYVYRLPIAALNSVNEQGRALITLQLSDKKSYQKKAFTIEKLSNDFIYLSTHQNALPLIVVTQGWQNIERQSLEKSNVSQSIGDKNMPIKELKK
jgi:RND family efflux transporter MFP subunit